MSAPSFISKATSCKASFLLDIFIWYDDFSPEAAEGGLIALVEDGDTILIDAESDQLVLKVDDDEIKRRQSIWKNPNSKPKKGVLAKYAESVKSASLGAITD